MDDTTTELATTDDSSNNCPNGHETCPGPDVSDWGDNFPCWNCYSKAKCPNGKVWCDNRDGADADALICRDCLILKLTPVEDY
jgi:hypothetical protein